MARVPRVISLALLLIATGVALMAGAPSGVFGESSIASSGDDEGGSTVPIPPPKRPTPQSPTPTPPETAVPTGSFIALRLANLSLSPGTRVQSTAGDLIPSTDKGIRVEADSSGAQGVTFPFALTPGQEVLAFQDPESGIAWLPASAGAEGGTLTIPLAGGQVPGGLTIELGPLQGNGQEAWAPILRAGLVVGPVVVEGAGPQGGAVRLSAELRPLPWDIALEVRGIATHSGLVSALGEAAGELNMGIAAMAYAIEIEADLDGMVASATVEMAVDEGWARTWPRDIIRIARISAEGGGRILETTPGTGDALGLAWFRAGSGEGFSTFALVAVGELTRGKSGSGLPWALGLGVGLGVVALVGLATGAFLLVASGRPSSGP